MKQKIITVHFWITAESENGTTHHKISSKSFTERFNADVGEVANTYRLEMLKMNPAFKEIHNYVKWDFPTYLE